MICNLIEAWGIKYSTPTKYFTIQETLIVENGAVSACPPFEFGDFKVKRPSSASTLDIVLLQHHAFSVLELSALPADVGEVHFLAKRDLSKELVALKMPFKIYLHVGNSDNIFDLLRQGQNLITNGIPPL